MVSVVMCSRDDQRFAAAADTWRKAMGDAPYELIRISDARSMSEGYNRGYLKARYDRVLFSHDDAFFLTGGLGEKLARHFERFDVFGPLGSSREVPPTFNSAGAPYIYGQLVMTEPPSVGTRVVVLSVPARSVPGIKFLDGVLIAATRAAVERLDGWDEVYPHFHGYDLDFSFRAHLAGLRVGVACDLDLMHTSGGTYESAEWREAATLFVKRHGPHLLPMLPQPRWSDTAITPRDLSHAAELMRPPHWDYPPFASAIVRSSATLAASADHGPAEIVGSS